MERWGLVAQHEAELERRISLGLVPQEGRLPSERTPGQPVWRLPHHRPRGPGAAACTRAGAGAPREAGARAVVMEEAVRLENLGVALLGEGPSHPERHSLLAGYMELQREVTVELLAGCCEKASEQELERVRGACWLLSDAVCCSFKPWRGRATAWPGGWSRTWTRPRCTGGRSAPCTRCAART
jgi:GntR family transcriptional repressor for pyruvate dehydrogenase complex